MKRFFLLLFAIFFASLAWAQASLTVSSVHHEQFWIYINDAIQNNSQTESINISGLAPGNYQIKIILNNKQYSEMSSSLRIHPGNNNYLLQYSPREGRISLESVNYDLQAAIFTTIAFNQMATDILDRYEQDRQDMRPPRHKHGNNPHNPQSPNYHDYPQNPQVVVINPAPAPFPQTFSSEDFMRLKMTIQNEDFNDTRLVIAKQAVASELMTSAQIAEIAQLFDFEKTKLDFLKYAYDFCYDKNKYYIVNNVLEFSSSKRELNEYIQGK